MSDHVELENRNTWHVSHDKTAKLKLNLKLMYIFKRNRQDKISSFFGGDVSLKTFYLWKGN